MICSICQRNLQPITGQLVCEPCHNDTKRDAIRIGNMARQVANQAKADELTAGQRLLLCKCIVAARLSRAVPLSDIELQQLSELFDKFDDNQQEKTNDHKSERSTPGNY